jgi:hypothetical protein
MRIRTFAIVGLLTFCFALSGGTASADSVAVQNASFEQIAAIGLPTACAGTGCMYNAGPIPDWTLSGVGAGSWQPGSNNVYFNQPLPDGPTVAYVNGTLSQDLDVTLLPNTEYTVTVDVGDRLDGYRGGWSIALDAGTMQMCESSGQTTSITVGTFAQETCSFITGSSVPSGDLSVILGGSGNGANATFDNVSVAAPEPAEIGMLAIGLFTIAVAGVLAKRKQGWQVIAS